jgi:hypothetical protein
MSDLAQSTNQLKGLSLPPLAPYEDRLLAGLAFFRTQRKSSTQAHHCLSMYLRQSESRIMSEIGFYAQMLKMEKWEFLELIYTEPDRAEKLIEEATGVKPGQTFQQL